MPIWFKDFLRFFLKGNSIGWFFFSKLRKLVFVKTADQLDSELSKVNPLVNSNYDAYISGLDKIHFKLGNQKVPSDPMSEEFIQYQFEIYRRITGFDRYELKNEFKNITEGFDLTRPYPMITQSSKVTSDYLLRLAALLRHLDLPKHSSILEIGAGYSDSTFKYAQLGFKTTVLDINPVLCKLIKKGTKQIEPAPTVKSIDMLQHFENNSEKYQAIIFMASFHHCSDHRRLLHLMHNSLVDQGRVFLVGEPIMHRDIGILPYQWGIRLDGRSLHSMRTFGVIELGFRKSYFKKILRDTGWRMSKLHIEGLSGEFIFQLSAIK